MLFCHYALFEQCPSTDEFERFDARCCRTPSSISLTQKCEDSAGLSRVARVEVTR